MRTIFDTGRGIGPVAEHILGGESYRDIRAVAEVVEELKHLVRYMPQLYRLYELTKDLTELTTIVDTGFPIDEVYSATNHNLVAGQTEFVVPDGYVKNQVVISVNGSALRKSEFYATNEKSFILVKPVLETDIVQIVGTRSRIVKIQSLYEAFLDFSRPIKLRVSSADGNLTPNQSIISVPTGFPPGAIFVFKNGQILRETDYNDSTGKEIIFKKPLAIDDVIDIRGQVILSSGDRDNPPIEDLPPIPNIYVYEENFSIPYTARAVFVKTLTTTCKLTLPDIMAFPESTLLIIGDTSGEASVNKYIDIVPFEGDSIAQMEEGLRIASPDAVVRLIRGSDRKWISL